jgi:dienelactone hydrolase
MHTEYIDYAEGKTMMEGYLAYDASITGKRPAVLVSHAWGGQGDFERSRAEALAAMGYVGFALDLYGKGVRGTSPEQNAKLMQPFLDDRAMLNRRMMAAVNAVKSHLMTDSKRLGAIGYCFGGLCVLDLARSGTPEVRGVASFHGILAGPPSTDKPRQAKQITAKVMAFHGFDDPFAKPESALAFAKEMTEAQADWQMHIFGRTVHGFAVPGLNMPDMGIVHSESADKRSWQALKSFLQETLG